jgi:uncharacterized protein
MMLDPSPLSQPRLRIAIVGGGVAGVASAWLLSRRHDVTLFERNNYVGGHTNTIVVPDGPDAGTPVDTGFIVLNDRTYPNFRRFLAQLGVDTQKSNMSFSYHHERSGFQYAGTGIDGVFAQRANAINPRFLGMLTDILKFNARARRDIAEDSVGDDTMAEYVRRHRLGEGIVRWYLVPMGAAIWSMTPGKMLEFPARTYLRFFENHGLLTLLDQPTWHVVKGGSFAYIKAFLAQFCGTVVKDAPIAGIRRTNAGVEVRLNGEAPQPFDRAVIATHADEALALLDNPTADERRLLGAWGYSRNATILHTDASMLPPLRRAWASWNYRLEATKKADGPRPLALTYHMNRLQSLRTREQYCVTLNTARAIPERRILRTINYTHPLYTAEALATQDDLPRLNGTDRLYFAGSYHRFGFHEDAVWSAVRVARCFGIGWESEPA